MIELTVVAPFDKMKDFDEYFYGIGVKTTPIDSEEDAEYKIELSEDNDCVYITTKSSSVEVVDDKMTFTLPVTILTALRSVLR